MVETVVIFNDYAYLTGGAGNVAFFSANQLAATGVRTILFTAVGPVQKKIFHPDLEIRCLNIKDINQSDKLKALKNGISNSVVNKALKKLLSELNSKTTIIHLHSWIKALAPGVLKVIHKQGFKMVITLHDYFTICPNGGLFHFKKQHICKLRPMSGECLCSNCDKRNYLQKLWRYVRSLYQKRYLQYCHHFFYISNINYQLVYNEIKKASFHYLPNPVLMASQPVTNIIKNSNYLFIGRVCMEKGIQLFCEAVRRAKVSGIVIGDGEDLVLCQKKYPEIQFLGWKDSTQIAFYVKQARCLIFPSVWYEGAPLTVIEMLSYQLPCIISDATSAVELIKHKYNGFVFKSNNLESLVSAIQLSLVDELLLEVQKNIKKMDLSMYQISTHVEKLKYYYNLILKEK